ncbi:5'-AMP-activated protein kinase beta subunit, interation domain-containing protein [Neohortaea acidophila]|uniref:5'-AMP-activated protein kinase beta subunit, interation domain-containing protein n=1 Tax=Neohortaea acidophila TaxID=245834 RepID=A0A6A6PZZ3_9PEZI|nr:5'-AMP-activated protein kinase beta subunit, interation domain-containing protein [Neohortaea acidophila]KAF2484747.1 5'-AMP-activated protein kinase beta subunit, interation domain-containing protein [Neohortaea acidophila]
MGQSESSPTTTTTSNPPSRKPSQRESNHSRGRDGHDSPSVKRVVPRNQTPPTTSNLSAAAASTSTSTEYAQASHSRSRSTTSASAPVNMGSSESKPQPPARSATLQTSSTSEKKQASPRRYPVAGDADSQQDISPAVVPTLFGLPESAWNHPPRLPLPIDRDPEPASPILTPRSGTPTVQNEVEGNLLEKESRLLSSTTLDDEEGGADIQQFAMETDPLAPKVPTTLIYPGEGDTVYVTGTFASWEKKFRMHKGKDGIFRATLPLHPGTHHITFLVDGDMKTSTDLPTTVDFAAALVNYIEVSSAQSPTADRQPTEAIPIPGAVDGPGRPAVNDHPLTGPAGHDELSSIQATGAPAPNQQPASLRPHSIPKQGGLTPQISQAGQQQPPAQSKPSKPKAPRPRYSSQIPTIFLHLDMYNNPEDPRYRLAVKASQNLPQPPSLPMFMSKSILNATTPQKDDASVLTMPNHTVLNHLATSSIRQGVLATSGTTRYKRKFLTTIMYKPTSDDG